jgi:hypothetical protein
MEPNKNEKFRLVVELDPVAAMVSSAWYPWFVLLSVCPPVII